MLAAFEAGVAERPRPRVLLSKALADRARASSRRCARIPASDRVELAGSARRLADSVKDLDLIATASDPPALLRAFAELDVDRRVRVRDGRAAERGARPHAHRHAGRPARRRARPVRQPAPALHRLQGAQRRAARGRRAARAARQRVRRARRRDRHDAPLRDRGGGLRAARPALDPARAARGPRRARPAAAPPTSRSSSSQDDLRGDLHLHTVASDGRDHDRADGARRARPRARVPRDHRPLGHPRLRQPRRRRRPAGADRGGARGQRAPRGDRAARRHRGEHPPRRLASTTRTTCWPSSTGSSPRSTRRSAWAGTR